MAAISVVNEILSAVDNNLISTKPSTGSAFLRAGTAQLSGKGGFLYTKVDGLVGQALPEGGTKVASGTVAAFKAIPEKFVVTTVYTDEQIMFARYIYEQIVSASPKANGVAFDRLVAGIDNLPAAFTAFDTFSDVEEAEVASSVDFDAAIGSSNATAIVGTKRMLATLRSFRTAVGGRELEVTGGIVDGSDATVDGIPYFVVDRKVSTDEWAIAGDFSTYFVAQVLAQDVIKVKDAGTVTDINSITHNLTSENKTAVFVENWLASAIGSDDFIKLVPVAVEEEEEEPVVEG